MKAIRSAGVRVVMVTGDYQTTAIAIGRMIGIITTQTPRLILGKELRDMSDAMLDWELEEKEVLFARLSPEQKLRIVQALQRHGHVVAVTGDGVNDAPALKQADIGVAWGFPGRMWHGRLRTWCFWMTTSPLCCLPSRKGAPSSTT
ncbi:HAD-IC family P-type ATPase [Geotalea toluenoxydans]|uniref:HAD-IC family P-type ATPase n=1 Tax=Geotalea toluenoxydans TaxID=421624 RepID=UPI000AB87DE3|nr:HAD-IC family P-type ATPase [Geotalea toluenoxydans]